MLYGHSSGEKHINAQGAWSDCAGALTVYGVLSGITAALMLIARGRVGQDNSNVNCSRGQILLQGVALADHLGPYSGGVRLGTGSDGAYC